MQSGNKCIGNQQCNRAFSRSAVQFSRIFSDFSIPMIISKLFKALKMSTLNSRTFQTFLGSVRTLLLGCTGGSDKLRISSTTWAKIPKTHPSAPSLQGDTCSYFQITFEQHTLTPNSSDMLASSSSSTNFIATQVLNKTSGPLCVTCYTSVNGAVAGSVRCRMIYGCMMNEGSGVLYSDIMQDAFFPWDSGWLVGCKPRPVSLDPDAWSLRDASSVLELVPTHGFAPRIQLGGRAVPCQVVWSAGLQTYDNLTGLRTWRVCPWGASWQWGM